MNKVNSVITIILLIKWISLSDLIRLDVAIKPIKAKGILQSNAACHVKPATQISLGISNCIRQVRPIEINAKGKTRQNGRIRGIVIKVVKYYTTRTIITHYILPILDYGSTVWHECGTIQTRRVEKLQESCFAFEDF